MPNRTVVAATAVTCLPLATSITQWPVNSVPVLPAIACQRPTASAGESGLPYARPSRSSIESQPMTSPSSRPAATAAALAEASTWVSSSVASAVVGVLVDTADDDLGIDAGRAQHGEPGGGRGSENDTHGSEP